MSTISVILTVYNGEQYIGECLESVLEQTFQDFEFIIVNDGSIDATREIISGYPSDKMIVIDQENHGVSRSLNRALEQARGEYFSYIAHDDWWSRDKLEVELDQIQKPPPAGVLYSDFHTVFPDGSKELARLPAPDPNVFLRGENFINISSCLVRMSCIHRLKSEEGYCFDEKMESCMDADFWLRLSRFCTFKHNPIPLSSYRVHPEQISNSYLHVKNKLKFVFKHNGVSLFTVRFFFEVYCKELIRLARKKEGHVIYKGI